MDAEILEIREHMGQFPPFDGLSDELLDAVAASVEVSYFKAGTPILELGDPIHELYFIRSGAVENYRHNGELFNRLTEGDIFGHFGLLRHRKVRFPAKAIEDTLVYLIPEATFDRLCEEDGDFADFVELSGPRLKAAVEQQKRENEMMVTRVRRLLTHSPSMIEADASAREAAALMAENQTSSVLTVRSSQSEDPQAFLGNDDQYWQLDGILTDRDLSKRIVAEGRSPEVAAREVATPEPVTIQSDETVFDAMLCMLRNNLHHLPVLHRRRPVGVLHLSDIVRFDTHSSLYLVSSIFSQTSVRGLERLMPDVRAAYVRLVDEGANSEMIGTAMATIGRSLIRRLIALAEEDLGPPPVPYCFMVLGSMARNEQNIATDQDNALVLDDRFDPEAHDAYFAELARQVSDGLAACGYHYCKGGIMATNPSWRQPLATWKRYFREWIADPQPKQLLHSSIFFDLDSAYGEERFVEELQDLAAGEASKSPLFLAAMARNALNRTPPLGFFRQFVMEQDGKQRNSINLKRRGTAPLVDLIRVHALACGSTAQNSIQRLDAIADAHILPAGATDRIRYALEFISMVRIRHQAFDIREGRDPDNNIEPENISDSERHHLKDAFQALSHAQKYLRFKYPFPSRR